MSNGNTTNNTNSSFATPTLTSNFNFKSYFKSSLLIASIITISNPIDLIRFRLQTTNQLLQRGIITNPYKGILDCLFRIIKEQGVRSLWKGTLANLLRIIPNQALIFTIKNTLQHSLILTNHSNLHNNQLLLANGLIGSFSSTITLFILYPFQYVRVVLSNQVIRTHNIWSCLRSTIKQRGLKGIFKGVGLSLIGVILFRGCYFGIYDSLKIHAKQPFRKWLLSYIAMCCAIYFAYPGDTIRRRMISSCGDYQNVVECIKRIIKNEGIRGFFGGSNIIMIQSIPAGSLLFVYDWLFGKMGNDCK